MADTQLSYRTGQPVKAGDWIRIEGGRASGRVREVVSSPEQAREKGLATRGVVVDAQPKGLVFLSEQCLSEDPLQFVRRGPGEEVRFQLAFALGLGAVLLLPAVYSLFEAIYSGIATGQVTVISLGYTSTHRESVPWQAGWARFAAPVLLVAGLCTFDGSRGTTVRWWFAGVATAIALVLLCFSAWFIDMRGASIFIALSAFLVIAGALDRRFGRRVAASFVLACTMLLVWQLVRTT
jgi:hypothetical protein